MKRGGEEDKEEVEREERVIASRDLCRARCLSTTSTSRTYIIACDIPHRSVCSSSSLLAKVLTTWRGTLIALRPPIHVATNVPLHNSSTLQIPRYTPAPTLTPTLTPAPRLMPGPRQRVAFLHSN
eukprot:TRINITY_DN14742_c0_g1_i1.p2 TRINITY_DN14742_c0_g1~~TRINITY_DN14742_c0_g1_i1.p2  ORF type:complete len:125 (-),score=17.69 TRINITY_DN14742_c0_g1_i1:36-410(-)